MRYGSMDSQVPSEPDSGGLLQGGQAHATQSAEPPATGFEREKATRPPYTSISVPRRCTAKDPFWIASSGSSQHRGGGAAASGGARGLAGLRCLGDVVDAADHEFELEVPEAELSTVHIETWEQRLDWRSFLSEAVASSRARQLFKAFDVDAEPPKYARPPPSSPVSVMENALPSGSPSQAAHLIAPSGAGWSPSGSASPSPSGAGSSSQFPWGAGSSSMLPPSPGPLRAGPAAPVDWTLAGGGGFGGNDAAGKAPAGLPTEEEFARGRGMQPPSPLATGHGGNSPGSEAFNPAFPHSLPSYSDAGL